MTGPVSAGEGFPRTARITRATEYQRVFDSACRVTSGNLTFMARPNRLGRARLGLAIAKKHLRTAVSRNRVKRQLRESFRRRGPSLPPLDIVVLARPGIARVPTPALREAIDRAWEELAQRCADSSSSPSAPTASP